MDDRENERSEDDVCVVIGRMGEDRGQEDDSDFEEVEPETQDEEEDGKTNGDDDPDPSNCWADTREALSGVKEDVDVLVNDLTVRKGARK